MKKFLFTLLILLPILIVTLYPIQASPAYAQLNGCAQIPVGNPNPNQPIPQQCQTNSSAVSCSTVTTVNKSYTVNGHSVSVTVWNCSQAAPLVIFVPGRGRSAADYGRYENAIATQGFTVAGINFGSENDGNHFSEETADIKALVGPLQGDSQLKIKSGGVGLVGHSDGALVATMEGYQGGNNSSIKAIIAADGASSGSSSGPPLLLLHGSKDQLDPTPPSISAYTANPKFHAEIIGADHFCYVAEKSVPGYAIDCETANLQQQTQALDALSAAFLQSQLYGCSNNSLSAVANQYKSYVTLEQSGTTTTTPCASAGAVGGFANPFPEGWQPNRLDMGYDGTFTGFIVAPFSGTIVYAATGVATWGGYLELKANQKPAGLPTSTVYFAEGLSPLVKTGDKVNVGQQIAKAVPNSVYNGIVGNIEFGVSTDGNGYVNTYAVTLGGSHCPDWTGQSRAMVLNFYQWVITTLHVPGKTTDESCAGSA